VGVGDKLSALRQLQANLQLERQQTAFIGDDLNDLAVRPAAGLLICPADGMHGIRRQADWILRRRGGDGAVRELAEALLQQRGLLQTLNREGWREGNA
jgi:3-deoxy-D-manno-octulosonate 8-phosphate phosphatase (KDO 8-P phosphatase)